MEILALYLLAGVIAGFVSGLFGLGGGLTMVPALVIALPLAGVTNLHVMHMAIGTSLAVMIVTAIYTTILRHRSGDMDWNLFRIFGPLVVIGAALGAALGDWLPGLALRILFISFVLYTIGRALYRRYLVNSNNTNDTPVVGAGLPAQAMVWIYGLLSGLFGALLGAGAAIIMVPFLKGSGYRIQIAAALAASLSAAIGIGAGTGYFIGGLNETGLPEWSAGYIFLPAFAGLSTGAFIGSPIGVKISNVLDQDLQFWMFLAYLATVLTVMATR